MRVSAPFFKGTRKTLCTNIGKACTGFRLKKRLRNGEEEEDHANTWFPVGFAGPFGRIGPSTVVQTGRWRVDAAREEDGVSRPASGQQCASETAADYDNTCPG